MGTWGSVSNDRDHQHSPEGDVQPVMEWHTATQCGGRQGADHRREQDGKAVGQGVEDCLELMEMSSGSQGAGRKR
jgi:hypothetical protein